jgi:hypothetical protein
MNLHRLITLLVEAIVALTVGLPAASAGSGIVDDYFRDAQRNVEQSTGVTNRIVDDYFRDTHRSIAASPGVTNRIVDDYFRDGPTAAVSVSSFQWRDLGIGIAAGLGAMLLLAGLAAGAVFRSRNRKTERAATT